MHSTSTDPTSHTPPLTNYPQRPTQNGQWNESALRVLKERYLKNHSTDGTETPEDMCWRVAMAIANAEQLRGVSDTDIQAIATSFYAMMVDGQFLPNSPTLMNAGKQNNLQFSACFVLPIDDSLQGIFETIKNAAIVHQSGGGTGFAFSRLRPKDTPITSTHGKASGPVSFLRVFNAATEAVKQGGTRRGANMGILRIDHPDILEFIDFKLDGGMTNFNISVAVTDTFMYALANDEMYELINPHTQVVTQHLRARDVFQRIVQAAWQTGDPGIVFIDRINTSPANPVPQDELIEATNPCLPGDTWILTDQGPRQITDLLNASFTAIINGATYPATPFWSTGVQPVLKITTDRGFSLRLTANHKVQIVQRRYRTTPQREYHHDTQWIEAGTLQPGDILTLHNHRGVDWKGHGTFEEGWLIGQILGDGCHNPGVVHGTALQFWGPTQEHMAAIAANAIRTLPYPIRSDFTGRKHNHFNHTITSSASALKILAAPYLTPKDKTPLPAIEQTSSDFHRGFLRGLFDTDGSVQGNSRKGCSVRLTQNKLLTLQIAQRMLARLGIISTIYLERKPARLAPLPNGKGGTALYPAQATHELVITKNNIREFAQQIGFHEPIKHQTLNTLLQSLTRDPYRETFTTRVTAITPDGIEEVYDCTVNTTHTLDANGFLAHNCGESPLGPYDACNLGSINLVRFILPSLPAETSPTDRIDWTELKRIVQTAVHFLDNVIDVNPYPLQDITTEVLNNRRIGLGVMGWADLLLELGIPYSSNKAIALAEEVMGFIRQIGHETSARLANERGPFPRWPRSIYKNTQPLRNSTVTIIAPTGTISIIAGCSSGIEPIFAVAFSHIVEDRHLTFVNPIFEKVAKHRGFYSEKLMRQVAEQGTVRGLAGVPEDVQRVFVTAHEIDSIWHIKMQAAFQRHTDNGVSKTINLPSSATPEDVAKAYLMAHEVGCLGITVFRDGCKGTQVLHLGTGAKPALSDAEKPILNLSEERPSPRIPCPDCGLPVSMPTSWDGSKSEETLCNDCYRKSEMPAPSEFSKPDVITQHDTSRAIPLITEPRRYSTLEVKPRPHKIHGVTYRAGTPLGTAFITINHNGDNEPFEIFASVGKAGSDTSAISEAIGRLLSMILRLPSPMSPNERVEQIVNQLSGIGGRQPIGFGKNRVRSLPDAIAQVLSEHINPTEPNVQEVHATPDKTTRKVGDMCPACGSASLAYEEGCQKCYSCGYSEC